MLCVACAGAGDGDTQAGPGGGEEKEGGSGETTAGGDEPQAEAGGAGGETQGEAEIAGILMLLLPLVPQGYGVLWHVSVLILLLLCHSPAC